MERKVEEFLEYLQKERRFSENTIEAYRGDLIQLVSFLQRKDKVNERCVKWSDVARQTLMNYTLTLQEQGYASSTIARKVAACKSLIKYLVASGVLSGLPTGEIGATPAKKVSPHILDKGEIGQLLRQTEDGTTPEVKRDRAMISLLYATGMRVSEMTALDIDDVDINQRAEPCVQCRGSKNKKRRISFDSQVARILTDYTEEARPQLLRDSGEQALFLNRLGRRLTRQGFWQILKGHAKAAKIEKKVTPHTLRHSNAVHMLQQGMDIQTLQQRLGHTNMSTTQVYAQFIQQDHPTSDKEFEGS